MNQVETDRDSLELFHFGIKGMKWGVRRKEGSDGTVGTGIKERRRSENSDDHAESRTLRKEKLSSLSNNEIQAINQRLELEKKYIELNNNKSTLRAGKKKVDHALAYGQTAQNVYTLANSPVSKAVVGLGKKFFKLFM